MRRIRVLSRILGLEVVRLLAFCVGYRLAFN